MRRSRLAIRNAQRGITLVEMMVVIAIIGLVMGAVVVAAFPQLAKARCKTAYGETQNIQQAIGMYRSDQSSECPKALSDLVSGHYISKEPVDPWGKPFIFKCPGEKNTDTADVSSAGPDKQEGTNDDIKGWMRAEEQCK